MRIIEEEIEEETEEEIEEHQPRLLEVGGRVWAGGCQEVSKEGGQQPGVEGIEEECQSVEEEYIRVVPE